MPKTTKVARYLNRKSFPLQFDIHDCKISVTVGPNLPVVDSDGNTVNDPILETYVRHGLLVAEYVADGGEVPIRFFKKPEKSLPTGGVVQIKGIAKGPGGKSVPIMHAPRPPMSPALSADAGKPIIPLTVDAAVKLGFIRRGGLAPESPVAETQGDNAGVAAVAPQLEADDRDTRIPPPTPNIEAARQLVNLSSGMSAQDVANVALRDNALVKDQADEIKRLREALAAAQAQKPAPMAVHAGANHGTSSDAAHQPASKPAGKYKCVACDYSTTSPVSFRGHARRHHPDAADSMLGLYGLASPAQGAATAAADAPAA